MSSAITVSIQKVLRAVVRRCDAQIGRLRGSSKTIEAMSLRPYELHLELTNLCNANCIFCPYQFQEREVQFMSSDVFKKAVSDFVACGGGSVGLTPIVGDALIDPHFVERVRYLRSQPAIDRIWITTNAILLDKHGIDEVLNSGLTSITISTSGFDEESYKRVYRSTAYHRFKNNIYCLLERNSHRSDPLHIVIGFRTDRSLSDVMADPDFLPILKHKPPIDYTWSFTSAGGRITNLPKSMRLRVVSKRPEPCVQLYNGPIVLPDGTVSSCSCLAAMDAIPDLGLGNILDSSLMDLWSSDRLKKIRAEFGTEQLNRTCAGCDMYRNLDMYRTSEGRKRAELNMARHEGKQIKREEKPSGAFSGG